MDIIIKKSILDDVNRIALYIDCDGVILDTNRYIREELLKQYGIDKWKHLRSNVEDDKKVSQFFKEFNWAYHIEKIPEINNSLKVIEALRDCGIFYGPTIFTTCTSSSEVKVKKEYFEDKLPDIDMIFNCNTKKPKNRSLDMPYVFNSMGNYPILVDDDPHNLNDWHGYSFPFNGGNPNYKFPSMESLEEIFEMYARINNFGEKYIPIYDDGRFQNDNILQMFDIDPNTNYVVTDTMRKNLTLRKR